ncbi:MAG TPA: hypothetical protein VGC97_09775, partial [Pyrinomonadaceae bacterium]
MKKHFYIFIAFLFLTVSAAAHPLGNFSVNQFAQLDVEKSRIKIRQILDMAEIPAFQLKGEIDTDKDSVISESELDAYAARLTPEFLSKLFLTVNDERAELSVESTKISMPEGAGNLPTLRIEWSLASNLQNLTGVNRARFENKNFDGRIGWNEIVLSRAGGVNVFDSNAFGNALSDELKTYPAENLSAPLAEKTAAFSFSTNPAPENARLLENRNGQASAAVQKDKLAEIIAVPELTPAIAVFGLLLAFGLGTLHALSPGHGKTVVGAYLVGSRGTPKHAAFLGLTVTITHTLGVFALGLITLFASNYILPERLLPFLGFVSGLLVLYIGLTMFKTRLFTALGWNTEEHRHHGEHFHAGDSHSHPHDEFTHTHDGQTHSHLPPAAISWKSLLALGVSGGLLPCPSALVLMLSAISMGRTGYGLILTTAFSFG